MRSFVVAKILCKIFFRVVVILFLLYITRERRAQAFSAIFLIVLSFRAGILIQYYNNMVL